MTMIIEEGIGGIPGYDYRAWIKSQEEERYDLNTDDKDHYTASTEFAVCEINFMDELNIVEFRMTRLRDEETCFYLHFQLNDREHAEQLYREMIQVLLDQKNHQIVKILLCCTAGLTTSFFAEKLTETAKTMSFDYEFEAMSVNDVYENAKNYKAVLLAPQIAYVYNKLKDMIPDTPVLKIPTSVFAGYDAAKGVEFVKEELQKEEEARKDKRPEHLIYEEENDARALEIVWIRDSSALKIGYRIYHHGLVEKEETVIRGSKELSLQDIEDIIETEICLSEKPDFIGIALPGIVNDGTVIYLGASFSEQNIEKILEEKYDIPVYVENNANAAAYGWYGHQEKYQNVVLLTMPKGLPNCGAGIVVNGRPVRGAHRFAGELWQAVNAWVPYEETEAHAFEPEYILKHMAKCASIVCTVVDPEAVLIRNEMTPDMDELRTAMAEILEEQYIPQLVYMADFEEYVFLGGILLSMWRYKQGDHTHQKH